MWRTESLEGGGEGRCGGIGAGGVEIARGVLLWDGLVMDLRCGVVGRKGVDEESCRKLEDDDIVCIRKGGVAMKVKLVEVMNVFCKGAGWRL